MSYLLDALRKSDEERKKSQVKQSSSHFNFTGNRPPTTKRKNTAAMILTSFMLVAALILGAGWWWSQKDQTQIQDLTQPPQKMEVNPAIAPEKETIPPPLDKKTVLQAQEASQSTDKVTAPARQTEQPSGKIPYLSEMSGEFPAALPELKFSGHVYSPTPELRMIMINNSVAREGDLIASDLTLVKITENGLIISFGGTTFQVKLF